MAPADGLIGATLVAAGEPVEYGQDVIVLEQLEEPRTHVPGATAGGTGAAAEHAPDAPAALAGDAPAPDAGAA